jgi:hypothetical protein
MNRFLVLFYSLSAAYSIVVLAVNSYRGCSVISRHLGSRIQRLNAWNGLNDRNRYFPPEGRQPRLLLARETGRPVVVSDFDKACG